MELYLVINIKNQREMEKSKMVKKGDKSVQLDYWNELFLNLAKF